MKRSSSIIDKLKKYADISRGIDTKSRALETVVGSAKLTAVDGFKPYINPKKNIDKLLLFYNTFISAKGTVDEERHRLSGIFGEARDEDKFSPRSLKTLKEKDVLSSLQTLLTMGDTLRRYKGVRVVATELESLSSFTGKVMDAVGESFFSSLKKLPEHDPELQEFATFLLSNVEKTRFISEYTNIVYSRLGFDDIGTNTKLLLERTHDLDRFFSDIVEMNDNILGVDNSRTTNVGLLKMFVIGLKRAIADSLIKVEKEERTEDVPFLIGLTSRLKQPADSRTRTVEELFVFKDDINKIICNCISGYFERLDMLMNPNKSSDIESLCLKIIGVLDAFYDHRDVAEVFAATYGSGFGVRTAEDIFAEFSGRTIEKILFLAESLRGISRSVYVINNVYAIQNYLGKVDGMSAHEVIERNTNSILDVWRTEISKRKEDDITEFLDVNIQNQSKYLLPSGVRDELVGNILKLIDEALSTKKYSNSIDDLHSSIEGLYSAK